MFSADEVVRMKAVRPVTARDLRVSQELSQTSVAERVGVKQPTINGWESPGEGSALSISEGQFYEYYQVLKTDPATFVAALPESVTLSGLSRKSLLMLMTAFAEGRDAD